MYSANIECKFGITEKSIIGMHSDTSASMTGQSSKQTGCSFFVKLLQDGNAKTHDRELKNPLHGSVADSGAMTVRNSL